jgi:predicted homoserine dehydrogenase-like protein
MILVDRELQKRHALGKPIRVGIVGAGFMCQGLTNQIENSIPVRRVAP